MENNDFNSVSYGVDRRDCICCVNDHWLPFAKDNGAPELTPEFVIGQSLWGFFRDQETIDLTQMVFDKVRLNDANFVIPFRCDRPGEFRPMVMLVQPGESRSINILTHTVIENIYPLIDLAPLAHRVGDLVKVCAWCCRIELLSKMWVEIEHAIADMSALSELVVPPISHGICPECFELVRAR